MASKRSKAAPAPPGDEEQAQLAALEELGTVQERLERINEQLSERVVELEREYNKLRRPIYTERSAAIRRIPGFWTQVLDGVPELMDIFTPDDLDVLKYLEDCVVEEADDITSGFRVEFHFLKNPYFANTKLFKNFRYGSDGQLSVEASKIDWFPGKNLVDQASDIAQAGAKRTADEASQTASFFSWFDEDEQDPSLGEMIKEIVWSDPLKFFLTNQVSEEDMDDDDDDDAAA